MARPGCVLGSSGLAAPAGCPEGGNSQQVGRVASAVEGGQVWAAFRCLCRWRGCDSGSGQKPHWERSRSPRGRTRRPQMAVVAAWWDTGPRPGPRSLWMWATGSRLENSHRSTCEQTEHTRPCSPAPTHPQYTLGEAHTCLGCTCVTCVLEHTATHLHTSTFLRNGPNLLIHNHALTCVHTHKGGVTGGGRVCTERV